MPTPKEKLLNDILQVGFPDSNVGTVVTLDRYRLIGRIDFFRHDLQYLMIYDSIGPV